MHHQEPELTLRHSLLFISECHSIRNTFRSGDDASVALRSLRKSRIAGSSFTARSTLPAPVKISLQTLQLSNHVHSSTGDYEYESSGQSRPQQQVRLFQSWRNPSWLYFSQLENDHKNARERKEVSSFTNLTHAILKIACMGLVLTALTGLHCIYDKTYRLVQDQVRSASAHLNAKVSIGRIVRCNPITGFRVKDVQVSKSPKHIRAPYGKASWVHASISGFAGFFLYKRPLKFNVAVNHGSFTVSNLVAREYIREPSEELNLQEALGMLTGACRTLSMSTKVQFSELFQPGTFSLNHSRLRVEGIKQGFEGDCVHHVDMSNFYSRLDFSNRNRAASLECKQASSTPVTILVGGKFPSGGYACARLNVEQNIDDSVRGYSTTLQANLTCVKVNISPISTFFSLPFHVVDGICTGNVEVLLSPSKSSIPSISGLAEVKSFGMRFDPNPESPELRNIVGKLRFKQNSLILDRVEGRLGSIPLEAKGYIDLIEGFNIECHARPFDINRLIETFALNRLIPFEASVIGRAVVQGVLEEPYVNGWIKSVGSHVIADRVLLKSAMMTYDWDAAAGNLLFPSIRATVLGGGELSGSGGIYYDTTRKTPYGSWNEKHHARNPKATYWNTHRSGNKTLPPLPLDDFEIDRWAAFRPYDSIDFQISGSDMSGGNLARWYGQDFGSVATEALGRIGGFCRIAGHADDANGRVVWRSVPQLSAHKFNESPTAGVPMPNLKRNDAGSNHKDSHSRSNLQQSQPLQSGSSSSVSSDVLSREETASSEESGSEFLGGLVHMKLGDLPEARRIKARITLKGLRLKHFFSADPSFRDILQRAPNIVTSMDTLFKGTVSMRPSWDDKRVMKSKRSIPLDLVSVDGGLAVRDLSLNGVMFRKIISGSLSLSATDISLNLSESNYQNSRPGLVLHDYHDRTALSGYPADTLEVKLNSKGFFKMFLKWDRSEISASLSTNEKKYQVARLHVKDVDIQQLLGRQNSLYGDKAIQGILTTSTELNLTRQKGYAHLSVVDLDLGPEHFDLVKCQLSLNDGEISMYGATLEHGLSTYRVDGSCILGEDFNYECSINVHLDRAHILDLSRLLEWGAKLQASKSHNLFFKTPRKEDSTSQSSASGKQYPNRRSSVTYWKVPEELSFAEQTKWFIQSGKKSTNPDFLRLLDFDDVRANLSDRIYDSKNNFSGRISINYASRRNQHKRRNSTGSPDRDFIAALGNTTLSFDLAGQDWTLGKNKIQYVKMSGFLEDGDLSIRPVQIKGEDGFLLEGQGCISNTGSLNGSITLNHAPVSDLNVFQRAGIEAAGNMHGKVGIQGNVSNPSFYGQLLWKNAKINGRFVSHPQVDLACSNGRCIINVDAMITGKEGKRQMQGVDDVSVLSAGAVKDTFNSTRASSGNNVETASSKAKSGVDSVTARLSIPVGLFVRQFVLPRLPNGLSQDNLTDIGHQHSFDDDWVYAAVDIRRYGMLVLGGLIPELGWIGGDSDISVRLSGTQSDPEITGFVKLKDGSMRPSWMTHPLQSLRGEIELRDSGLLFSKSLCGRCNGRAVSMRGGLFLSKKISDRLEEKVEGLQEMAIPSESGKRKQSQELLESLDLAASALNAGRAGIQIKVGGIPLDITGMCTGTVSGKLTITGSVWSPQVAGSMLFSEGIISVNSALTDLGKGKTTTSHQPALTKRVSVVQREPVDVSRKACDYTRERENTHGIARHHRGGPRLQVYITALTLDFGRNVRIVHPFLFNVLATGRTSFSGEASSPSFSGKVRIRSGSVSALPTRWVVKRSESSYVCFAHDQSRTDDRQEPTIKLVLESDTVILRVAECAVSSWMDNLSLYDKAGNRVTGKWWADAIHLKDDKRDGQKIMNLLIGAMINALAIGGEFGKNEWKLFPTYSGNVSPIPSAQFSEKYGAGVQFDQNNFCLEGNLFVDKLRGGQIMLKLARAISLHFYGDQSRRFADFELKLRGRQ